MGIPGRDAAVKRNEICIMEPIRVYQKIRDKAIFGDPGACPRAAREEE